MSTPQPELDLHARMIRTWWESHHPSEWAAMTDRDTFLLDNASQLRAAICQTQADLQRQLPNDLPFLDQVAAIRQTQLQAEEIVLADWLPEVAEPSELVTTEP